MFIYFGYYFCDNFSNYPKNHKCFNNVLLKIATDLFVLKICNHANKLFFRIITLMTYCDIPIMFFFCLNNNIVCDRLVYTVYTKYTSYTHEPYKFNLSKYL